MSDQPDLTVKWYPKEVAVVEMFRRFDHEKGIYLREHHVTWSLQGRSRAECACGWAAESEADEPTNDKAARVHLNQAAGALLRLEVLEYE